MKTKGKYQTTLLNSKLSFYEESLNSQTIEFQSHLNKNSFNQLLNTEDLKIKTSVLLSHANNAERERDFRKTCLLNQENCYFNPELNEAYQEYIKSYHKITSLYLIHRISNKYRENYSFESDKRDDADYLINLHIYNTEIEREEVKVLDIPKMLAFGTQLIQLPNGELFWCGNRIDNSGIALIIGNDYKVSMLPPGAPYMSWLAIYFNRSVYCFGGSNTDADCILASKFDLDKNRWITLALIPEADILCSGLIFNGNILISSRFRKTLWLYSIDIDSFSTIPSECDRFSRKNMINTEERLYIIECPGSIYESGIGDEYNWKKIAESEIKDISSSYWTYKKGGIYIGCIEIEDFGTYPKTAYYKFDLDKKVLIKLRNPL